MLNGFFYKIIQMKIQPSWIHMTMWAGVDGSLVKLAGYDEVWCQIRNDINECVCI